MGGKERARSVSAPGQVEEKEEGTNDDAESGASRWLVPGSARASCGPSGSLMCHHHLLRGPLSPAPASAALISLLVLTSHPPGPGAASTLALVRSGARGRPGKRGCRGSRVSRALKSRHDAVQLSSVRVCAGQTVRMNPDGKRFRPFSAPC